MESNARYKNVTDWWRVAGGLIICAVFIAELCIPIFIWGWAKVGRYYIGAAEVVFAIGVLLLALDAINPRRVIILIPKIWEKN